MLSVVMIATAGFGALPDNTVTKAFQNVIGEYFPPMLLDPFNAFMRKLSAPQIPLEPASGSDGDSPPDPVGFILSLFAENIPAVVVNETPLSIDSTLVALASTQTEVASIQYIRLTMTQFQIETLTAIPTITVTVPPTLTQTTIPTSTPQLVYYYYPPTATEELAPAPTFTPTNTPTPVPNHLTLYKGATTTGGFGPRSSADALCAASLPAGFSNYHAFVGFSASDSIANMATNYGMPTSLPIQSVTNTVIANNWADLMDGSIASALSASGVLSPGDWWWSGAEDGFGNHINGTTPACIGWSSSSGSDPGSAGYHGATNLNWLRDTVAGCGDPLALLCIAY